MADVINSQLTIGSFMEITAGGSKVLRLLSRYEKWEKDFRWQVDNVQWIASHRNGVTLTATTPLEKSELRGKAFILWLDIISKELDIK